MHIYAVDIRICTTCTCTAVPTFQGRRLSPSRGFLLARLLLKVVPIRTNVTMGTFWGLWELLPTCLLRILDVFFSFGTMIDFEVCQGLQIPQNEIARVCQLKFFSRGPVMHKFAMVSVHKKTQK